MISVILAAGRGRRMGNGNGTGPGVPEPKVLLKDGDVLYDTRLMERLVRSGIGNCLLMDRNIEPGDEPVKLCIRDGRIVDFHKIPKNAHDWHGESVGFFRLSPAIAETL